MRNLLYLALSLVVSPGFHRAPSPAAPTARPAIVGGSTDAADPAVVSVNLLFWPTCSGTLIGPHTVLTAGHCIFHIPLLSTNVGFGPSAWSPQRRVKVVKALTHPLYTGEGAPYDIGLLELATAVTDVPPLYVSLAPMSAADVGSTLRHVGYGATSDWYPLGLGKKRSVSYGITKVTDALVYSGGAGKQTCDGDSGGPGLRANAIGAETIVSVTSDGPNCHDTGWDSRTDVSAAWIASVQADWDR